MFVSAKANNDMETFELKDDLIVFGTQVKTFPLGIAETFDALARMIPNGLQRDYYGVSYVEDDTIIYWAVTGEKEKGEASNYPCETMVVKKGAYAVKPIKEWRDKTDTIKDVFAELLNEACPPKESPCVEWYKSYEEMWCMVCIDE